MFDLYEQSISVGPLKIAGAFGLIALLLLAILVLYSPGAAGPVDARVEGHSFRIEKVSRELSLSTEHIAWKVTYPTRRFNASPEFTYDIPLLQKQGDPDPSMMYASLEIGKGYVEKIVFSGSSREAAETTLNKKFRVEKKFLYLFRVDEKRFLIHFGSEEEMYFFEQ